MFTYLIKFDDKGGRIDTLVADEKTVEQVEALLSEGYISISEDDYQKIIGNVDGKEYIKNPETGELEEAPAPEWKYPSEEERLQIEANNTKANLQTMAITAMMMTLAGDDISSMKDEYQTSLMSINDDVALQIPDVFPIWSGDGVEYKKDIKLTYNGVLYKVLQDHTSQSTWTPDAAPSLFTKVLTSTDGQPSQWIQPDSTNPYMMGDKVIYNGHCYQSTIDNNVWAPDAYPDGWNMLY